MGPDFHPIHGAEGWQLSNPPILSLAAIRASMEIFDEIGMDRLRQKSELLTGYLEYLIKNKTHGCVKVTTPDDPIQRGCQLSLVVPGDGKSAYKSLSERGVVCDWREPDVIRVAPVPLYNSFRDIYLFVEILAGVVA